MVHFTAFRMGVLVPLDGCGYFQLQLQHLLLKVSERKEEIGGQGNRITGEWGTGNEGTRE